MKERDCLSHWKVAWRKHVGSKNYSKSKALLPLFVLDASSALYVLSYPSSAAMLLTLPYDHSPPHDLHLGSDYGMTVETCRPVMEPQSFKISHTFVSLN